MKKNNKKEKFMNTEKQNKANKKKRTSFYRAFFQRRERDGLLKRY
jgi:hypothetical protein